MIDYYEILGVTPDATLEEIRKAYRARAIRWHPDKWSAEPEADRKAARTRFEQIQEAYEHLRDPDKRAVIDRTGGVDSVAAGRIRRNATGGNHSSSGSYAAEVARELREAIENAANATTPSRRRYWKNKAQSWERSLDPIISMITNSATPASSVGLNKRHTRKHRRSKTHRRGRALLIASILVTVAIVASVIAIQVMASPPAGSTMSNPL